MKKILLLLVLLIFISCTTKYIPVRSENVTVTEDFGVLKTKNYTLAVENRYWDKAPREVADYFTTFYITVKNRTSEKMKIKPENIGLLDEDGNQFDVVSLDYIEKFLLPKQMEYLMISNIEDDLFDFETEDEKNIFEKLVDDQKDFLQRWRNSKRNLMKYAFHFGTIQAGAQKSGFIYFPKLEARNNSCQIIFRGKNIDFIQNDVK
ncbi:MAG: hypothetical protein HN952_04955 [Candidatus Cloacimonetes bacterium]|jgi:hypothetical protein|nr:hypothetical protein [Candidatus Cloacimonadota bacterium]MBT6994289.1 hypothetical protein [Candidatus Cloacimonadota bacterium]MBT7469873.1 hypothetical protein [Candidatus Cloacimonadota bacterium]